MRERIFAVSIAGLVLVSCSADQQLSQGGLSAASLSPDNSAASRAPEHTCGGSHGVMVTPCPVMLNKKTPNGVVVTVGGPGVFGSALERGGGCEQSQTCILQQQGGSRSTTWLVTSGSICGTVEQGFVGLDNAGFTIGVGWLKIVNKYCPT
jgi:hypothetical protein